MERILSEAEWAQLSQVKINCFKNVSEPISDDQLILAATKLYKIGGQKIPEFKIVDSPLSALSLRHSLKSSLVGKSLWHLLVDSVWKLTNQIFSKKRRSIGEITRNSYFASFRQLLEEPFEDFIWISLTQVFKLDDLVRNLLYDSFLFYQQKSTIAWISSLVILGIEFSQQELSDYELISKNLSFILPYEEVCIISRNPIFVGWDDMGRLHADNRAAVEYADGFQIWAINGVIVPESVVMEPEKQTLEQIQNEPDTEVQRIRIERFTWDRYLSESDAKVLYFQKSPNGTLESLMQCKDYTVLCTYDPSTGRPYSLEVNPNCKTCEEAQAYLLAPGIALSGLGIICKSVYPLIRT